jgi:hypothetical protein
MDRLPLATLPAAHCYSSDDLVTFSLEMSSRRLAGLRSLERVRDNGRRISADHD